MLIQLSYYLASSVIGAILFFAIVAFLLLSYGETDLGSVNLDDELKKKVASKVSVLKRKDGKTKQGVHGLPPGQILLNKWIVLDLGKRPPHGSYDLTDDAINWSLELITPDKKSCLISYANLCSDFLLENLSNYDWHCVTGWSHKGLQFQGIPLAKFLEKYKIHDWKWMVQHSPEGYVAPVYVEDIEGAFIVMKDGNGAIPSMEHGGVRIIFPKLFGWKSCKWVKTIEFVEEYRAGFWERIGCHPRGRIEFDERWAPNASKLWTLLSNANMVWMKFGGLSFVPVMQVSGMVLGVCVRFLQRIGLRK